MSTLMPSAAPAKSGPPATPLNAFEIVRTETIVATPDIVWETLLEIVGPLCVRGTDPMPMTLEAWPGGRWFRDTGNNSGHLWGHVQVIKPMKVLEICGPLFMSYAATSHVQYRLTPEGSTATTLAFRHTATGLIPAELHTGMHDGWGAELRAIREHAEKRSTKR